MNNKDKVLNWDQFRSLGNPDNAEELKEEAVKGNMKIAIKVHYEKKGRGGKEAVIIRGLGDDGLHDLEEICKKLKSKIGVGGAAKDGEIILQGNHRDKIVQLLTEMGFTNVKKAGG